MEARKQSRYIRAIERMHSVSAAAEELGISQPALSMFLKKLEGEAGCVLLDRSKGAMVLTEAGRAYLDYLDGVDKLERTFQKRVSDIESLRQGRLVIGGASSYNIAYLPQAIVAFSERYPGVNVEVVDGTVPNIEALALEGELDLLITPRVDEVASFMYEELAEERLLVCLPPEWEENEQLPRPGEDGVAVVTEDDLAPLGGRTFVMLRESQQIGCAFRNLLNRCGIEPGKTVHVDQTLTGLALTLRGIGASMVADGTLFNVDFADKPKMYFCDCDLCVRKLYVAYPKNAYVSVAARKFIEVLRETKS